MTDQGLLKQPLIGENGRGWNCTGRIWGRGGRKRKWGRKEIKKALWRVCLINKQEQNTEITMWNERHGVSFADLNDLHTQHHNIRLLGRQILIFSDNKTTLSLYQPSREQSERVYDPLDIPSQDLVRSRQKVQIHQSAVCHARAWELHGSDNEEVIHQDACIILVGSPCLRVSGRFSPMLPHHRARLHSHSLPPRT